MEAIGVAPLPAETSSSGVSGGCVRQNGPAAGCALRLMPGASAWCIQAVPLALIPSAACWVLMVRSIASSRSGEEAMVKQRHTSPPGRGRRSVTNCPAWKRMTAPDSVAKRKVLTPGASSEIAMQRSRSSPPRQMAGSATYSAARAWTGKACASASAMKAFALVT